MDRTHPSLSIVVNNYNYESYLEQALDSALHQMREQDELIVVDDGSTDNSPAILEQFQAAGNVTVISQQNQGQMKAVRTGIGAASKDVVVLLDSDDYLMAGYLDRLREIYRENAAVSFVFANPEVIGDNAALVEETRDILDRMAFPPGLIGSTRWAALLFQEFVGVPTSGNSMRLRLAKQIVDLPAAVDHTVLLKAWEKWLFGISPQESRKHGFSADGVIVTCTSALGAIKFYDPRPGFVYRLHSSNKYATSPRRGRWYLRRHRKRLLSPILTSHFSIAKRPGATDLREEILGRSWALNRRRRLRIRIEYCLATLKSRGTLREKISTLAAILAPRGARGS